MIRYEVDDRHLLAAVFLLFVNQIWPGDYEETKTQEALQKTLNITAWEGETLVGCLRILSDGYFFGTITECLVLPSYQNKGIGSKLLSLSKEHTPTSLYFGAQPGRSRFMKEMDAKEVWLPFGWRKNEKKVAGTKRDGGQSP